jgi:PST family polysaccharide transporter
MANAVMTFKDKTNILLIGTFIGTGAVAEFDLALKIKDLLFIPIDLLNQTIYPKIAREKNMAFMLKILRIALIVMTGVSIVVFIVIKPIILLLGGANLFHSIGISKIILISIPFTVISFTLAANCINALGYYNLRFKIMMWTTLSYFVLITFGYFAGWTSIIEFYAYVIVIIYLLELGYRLFIINKYKMLK